MNAALHAEAPQIAEVVLTGGACSGKTSALAHLAAALPLRGVRCLQVPEVATMLIAGGLADLSQIAEQNPDRFMALEGEILDLQLALEDHYRRLARCFTGEPVVIVKDRGVLDIQAFVGASTLDALLADRGLTRTRVAEANDAVIHMVTAADGAREHYTTANNPARSETPEQAVAQDRSLLAAWTGHSHLRIADNSVAFAAKLDRVTNVILGALGMPAIEDEQWFELSDPPVDLDQRLIKHGAATVQIEQTYLRAPAPGVQVRVRRRVLGGAATYTWTRKRDLPSGGREEREAQITASEYLRLLDDADPDHAPLAKTRYCLAYGASYLELDRIPRADGRVCWKLEIERVTPDDQPHIPDWVGPVRDVTGDPAISSEQLALT